MEEVKQEVAEQVKQGLMDNIKTEEQSWDQSSWGKSSRGQSWGQHSWKPAWKHGGWNQRQYNHPWSNQKWSDEKRGDDPNHGGFPDANIVRFSFMLGHRFMKE